MTRPTTGATRNAALLITVTLAALTAACSTPATVTPTPSSSPATSPSPAFDPEDVLQDYFPVLAQGTRAAAARAQHVTVPGSPAAVFAQHQSNMIRGADASINQQPWVMSSSVVSADEVDWSTSFASRSTDTSQFSNFLFDATGRLVTWQITPRLPLADAVAVIDRDADLPQVTFTVTTAYRTSDGDLQIAYHAASRQPDAAIDLDGYLQGGSRRTGITEPYRLELSPRATQAGFSIFPRSTFGGQLSITSSYPLDGADQVDINPRPWPRPVTQQMEEGTTP